VLFLIDDYSFSPAEIVIGLFSLNVSWSRIICLNVKKAVIKALKRRGSGQVEWVVLLWRVHY